MGSKTMCEVGMKKRKKRLGSSARYECEKCEVKVEKKKWLCNPVKI